MSKRPIFHIDSFAVLAASRGFFEDKIKADFKVQPHSIYRDRKHNPRGPGNYRKIAGKLMCRKCNRKSYYDESSKVISLYWPSVNVNIGGGGGGVGSGGGGGVSGFSET